MAVAAPARVVVRVILLYFYLLDLGIEMRDLQRGRGLISTQVLGRHCEILLSFCLTGIKL